MIVHTTAFMDDGQLTTDQKPSQAGKPDCLCREPTSQYQTSRFRHT